MELDDREEDDEFEPDPDDEEEPDYVDALEFADVDVDTASGATNAFLVQLGTDGDGTDWDGVAPYRPAHRALGVSADCDDPEAMLIAKESFFSALDEAAGVLAAFFSRTPNAR